MFFNAISENKILAKISEFTVINVTARHTLHSFFILVAMQLSCRYLTGPLV